MNWSLIGHCWITDTFLACPGESSIPILRTCDDLITFIPGPTVQLVRFQWNSDPTVSSILRGNGAPEVQSSRPVTLILDSWTRTIHHEKENRKPRVCTIISLSLAAGSGVDRGGNKKMRETGWKGERERARGGERRKERKKREREDTLHDTTPTRLTARGPGRHWLLVRFL